MAGFGDSNDIKISVTLDTKDAVDGVKKLTDEINLFLKRVDAPFKKLGELSKEAARVQIADIKAKRDVEIKTIDDLDKANQRKHERMIERIRAEVGIEKVASNEFIQLERMRVNESIKLNQQKQQTVRKTLEETNKLSIASMAAQLEAQKSSNVKEAKEFAEKEKNKRSEINKTIAEINRETAEIRKRKVSGPKVDAGGDVFGSGKLINSLQSSIAGLSFQFGSVNVGFASFINNFKNLGAVGGTIAGIVAAIGVIQKLDKQIDELAANANKLEGLATGFNTLQKSVGQDPSKSIQSLREATRGLVSDVEIYQRANQAVLLGVPTKVFNEAAGAAVKLGRAMGIDASLGLESLSLGLGRQSRLYLDNLGIIVSAEEAYKNFGNAIGKSANDLTDAEKKAAFFAESLKKIKERAEELPEPLDTVGIALQRVQAAQDNANAKFSEGFNSSKRLVDAYKEQAAIAQQNGAINEKFGAAVGAVGSVFKSLANDVRLGLTVAKSGFTEFVDVFADLTKEDELSTLKRRIDELEESTNRLREARAKNNLGPTLTARLAEEEKALALARKEAEALELEIQRLRIEGAQGIKINVDTSDISTAQNDFKNFFATLKQDTAELNGNIEVPGLKPETVNAVSEAYKNLTTQQLQGKLSAEQFNAEFEKIVNTISGELQADKLAPLANQLKALEEGSKVAGANTEEYATEIKKVQAQIQAAASATGLYGKAQAQLKKVLDLSGSAGKKAYQDILSSQKKAGNEAKRDVNQRKQQLKELTKSLGRALDQAIPADVQRELVDIFNKPQVPADELRRKIEAIGEAFLNSGGDYQAFAKEVSALNKLKLDDPTKLIQGSSSNQNALNEFNENLKKIKAQSVDIRKLLFGDGTDASGKELGGGFFGFNIGMDPNAEAALAGQIQDFLSGAMQAGVDGFSREDVPQIAAGVGALIGGGIAAYFSGGDPTITAAGAQAGAAIGQAFSSALSTFGEDLDGTKERKTIDEYLATIFDRGRLSVVIQGQLTGAIDEATGAAIRAAQPQFARISDLVFEGFTQFGGEVDFGGENFSNYFNTLSAEVQNSFNGVGLAIGTLQGVSSETARLIGTAIANNIGGSLQNLQVLVQQTGESFEDLSNAIIKAFRDAQLTAEEAYNALVQLQNIYSEGIPGAIGAFQEAIDNLNYSLQNDQPGQYAIDSLRDIGAEGREAGAAFGTVISSLAQTFGFAADQQARLFEALRASGIASLEELAKASDVQLLTLIRNINAIKDNAAAPLATVPVVPVATPTPRIGGGGGGRSKRDEAAELLKRQRDEALKLTQDSQSYLEIIKKINAGQLTSIDAGKQIAKINADLLRDIIRRDKIEEKLSAELNKGSKGNKKRIGELSQELAKLEERLDAVKQKTKESERQYKQLDISGIIPLIKSQNSLGLIAKQIGVSLQKNVDILVKGFLQGRMSIAQVNEEIKKTKDLLGPGIPGAVGAVTEAFQNLIDAGTEGGKFSTDAFVDIFAEFREKFNKEGSAFREAQRKQLNDNLDAARKAALSAVGPEATEAANKALAVAKKALEDFKNLPLTPDLSDLREQLKNSFSPEQVDLFFQALDESGLKSFEELEGASEEAIVGILGRLSELGFKFGQTSEEAKGINKGLQDAETAANAGLDPLKEAIDLVKQFNSGASGLPPVFNSTTQAISDLNGPLSKLADGFDNIIEKLGLLSGNTFENDVVFNIRTIGDEGGKALVDLVFGDGSQAGNDSGAGTPPSTGGGGGGRGGGGKGGGGSSNGKRSDWVRISPGVYKNKKTGRTVKSSKNPGA